MTPFLSGMTPHGVERVRRLRAAATSEEMGAFIQQMGVDLATELASGPVFTPADEYVFAFAIAVKAAAVPRASAASYDGAAQVALSARAFHEALFALEKAEEARPCPERRKTIAELRRALLPGEGKARIVKKPSANRTGRARRT